MAVSHVGRRGLGILCVIVVMAMAGTGCANSKNESVEVPAQSTSVGPPAPPGVEVSAPAQPLLNLGSGSLQTVHSSSWMGALFQQKPDARLRDIVIPGTHDAGTFALTCTSSLVIPSGDEIAKLAFLDTMKKIGLDVLYPGLVRKVQSVIADALPALWKSFKQGYCPIQSMAKAQGGDPNSGSATENSGNFLTQLNSGVRFFDIRLYEKNPAADTPDGQGSDLRK